MITRRSMIKHIAYAGATLPVIVPRLARAQSANSKLNIAGIGVGGRGWNDITLVAPGQNIVALCDVDQRKSEAGGRKWGIGHAAEQFPSARRYSDWRKLLSESKDIDAVTIATPDHMHALIALSAMQLGKHVYLEKPLAHNIAEIRALVAAARKTGVVTQMGNQNHAAVGYRMTVKLLQDGVIGKIKEAHGWSNNQRWPIYTLRPRHTDPIPDGFDWDLWTGVAKMRPFVEDAYHPWAWRGWVEFGSALQGDMGCHIFDPLMSGLDLAPPRALTVQTAPWKGEAWTSWRISRYEFAGTKFTASDSLPYTWWDGGHTPPVEIAHMPAGRRLPEQGSIFVGTEGTLVIAHEPKAPLLFPEEKFRDIQRNLPKFEPLDHHQQWVACCKNPRGAKPGSNFDYAGPLAETVQLAGVAARYPGQRLEWDAGHMTFTNQPDANAYLTREYRKGWSLPTV